MEQIDLFKENEVIVKSNPTLKDIFTLQKHMECMDNQLDVNEGLQHNFHDGVYCREMKLPKGMLIVGKVHKHAHLNIISRGHCVVYTTEGEKIIDARTQPITFVSSPGTKRVVLALEDTYWTTIHLTPSTDLKEIEREIIIPESDFTELLESITLKQITGDTI